MRKIIKAIMIMILCVGLIRYYRLPDYRVKSSNRQAFENYCESVLNIVVYKSPYNKYLYEAIEKEFIRVNGNMNKVTFNLYFPWSGKKPYRKVVFDYDRKIEYILIDQF